MTKRSHNQIEQDREFVRYGSARAIYSDDGTGLPLLTPESRKALERMT